MTDRKECVRQAEEVLFVIMVGQSGRHSGRPFTLASVMVIDWSSSCQRRAKEVGVVLERKDKIDSQDP